MGTITSARRTYKDSYRPIYSPAFRFFAFGRKDLKGRRMWWFDPWGFLFDRGDGILRGVYAWDRSVSPSYADALSTLWDNLLTWLTPFYRPRRALLSALANDNDTKLLSMDRKSVYMRNRRQDCTYCQIECGFRQATVRLIRYVDTKSGAGVCTFLQGTDGTRREERIVWRGPCLTWAECDRIYDAVRRVTPELDWFNKEEA